MKFLHFAPYYLTFAVLSLYKKMEGFNEDTKFYKFFPDGEITYERFLLFYNHINEYDPLAFYMMILAPNATVFFGILTIISAVWL